MRCDNFQNHRDAVVHFEKSKMYRIQNVLIMVKIDRRRTTSTFQMCSTDEQPQSVTTDLHLLRKYDRR